MVILAITWMLLGKSCKGFDFKKVESPEAASVVMRDVSG